MEEVVHWQYETVLIFPFNLQTITRALDVVKRRGGETTGALQYNAKPFSIYSTTQQTALNYYIQPAYTVSHKYYKLHKLRLKFYAILNICPAAF